MALVGRKKEQQTLLEKYDSNRPEFIAVIGRRRIGKTYLVTETFKDDFAFKHTGLSPVELEDIRKADNKTYLDIQLKHFYHSLQRYGLKDGKIPHDWLEAFYMLEKLLEQLPKEKRKVVFIDEVPWLDTPKSLFITGLEAFINGWANTQNILFVVSGSAIYWMSKEIINNHGGLFNRITGTIALEPLSLGETELLLQDNHLTLSRYDITQAYMVLGGVPYYLNQLRRGLSLSSNIDELFFKKTSSLVNEFKLQFSSSFKDNTLTEAIVRAVSTKKIGLTRQEIISVTNSSDGERFSKALNALIDSHYLVKYRPIQSDKLLYKLIDSFCLFYLHFVDKKYHLDSSFFASNLDSQKVVSWKGLAFENVCYNHIEQIKEALNIRGISSSRYSFIYKGEKEKEGSQIDLVLERKDNIVNLCEMKFYSENYKADKNSHLKLVNKESILKQYIAKKQIVNSVLITTYGIVKNEYQWDYTNVVVIDDLFKIV